MDGQVTEGHDLRSLPLAILEINFQLMVSGDGTEFEGIVHLGEIARSLGKVGLETGQGHAGGGVEERDGFEGGLVSVGLVHVSYRSIR